MPALSPTMTQGNVGAWQKAVGDQLTPGDVLVEIETDKAQMDFEFQEDGYLAKILVEQGAKEVPVGKPIGVYVENEDDVAAFADFTAEDAGGVPSKEVPKEAPKEEPKEEPEGQSAETPKEEPKETKSKPKTEGKSSSSDQRIKASPIAKMIALEQGIPLKDITGSGPGGRIIKRDVENYSPPAPAAASASSTSAPGPSAQKASAPSASAYEDIPISQMRRTIAKRLQESKVTSPHYIVSAVISADKLLKLRAALNETSDGSYKLSVNDILIKAMAVANLKVPQVNTSWLDAEGVLRQWADVDVSVAVATPTGLITPVVKQVNKKGLVTISNEIKELGKRAREGKLFPEEYQGGTVTISNLGMNHAVSSFTAIINPPQSAILAVGTVERRAIEDPESENGIAFENTITVNASFDHRVVDGAVGGEWIKAFKKVLENPLELLL